MQKTKISIGALGGTVSMVRRPHGQGVTPELSAADLLACVPELADVADIQAQTLVQLPSAYLRFETVLACFDWAKAQVRQGAQGVVLTQGTDSLEETAFLLDLLWDCEEPLVLTGAMRPPQQAGADGPGNILAAVITAGAAGSRGRGVMVVMNDWIHQARWVQKTHTSDVDAFQSQIGAAGIVFEQTCQYFHPPAKRLVLARPKRTDGRILLWQCALSDETDVLDCLLAAGSYQGLVLSAFGAGHVSAAMAEKIAALTPEMPVVVCSRTGGGSTAFKTYGYIGAEIDLIKKGAVMGGWLSTLKARLLLWLIVANQLPLSMFDAYCASLIYQENAATETKSRGKR